MILIVQYRVAKLEYFGRYRPLVATSKLEYFQWEHIQCIRASLVNITSVSEIQDTPEKPIQKRKRKIQCAMTHIWYYHQLSIPLNTVRNDSYLVCIEHLSLSSDSGLPMDLANGSDFGLGFDLTVGHGFNLGSSSLVYPSVK
ncbi:hypothetical protein CMV_014459 [Castanea mollissima]|uniref:Uncharacterized protein n=1 Tax=Castanea mollissima TaxID=60419 RepID=A0A8J4R452_9ROSI|nr:hypothetical protein CMV_014459 [Castanea mollissima]